MDATICDRCGETMVTGTDPVYRIVKTDFNVMGILEEHSRIDLCEDCNEKFNRFMNKEEE